MPDPVIRNGAAELTGSSRLLGIVLLLITTALIPGERVWWIGVLLGVLCVWSRTSAWRLLWQTRLAWPFIAVFTLTSGNATLVLRAVVSALLAAWLTLTTREDELIRGATRLGLPPILASLIATLLRGMTVLEGEAVRMRQAATVRGWTPRWPGRRPFAASAALLGTLLGRTLVRADRVQAALEARGFTGVLPLRKEAAWSHRDWIWMLAVSVPAVLVGVWR